MRKEADDEYNAEASKGLQLRQGIDLSFKDSNILANMTDRDKYLKNFDEQLHEIALKTQLIITKRYIIGTKCSGAVS